MPGRPKGTSKPKGTKIEIKRRVHEVFKMLLAGVSRGEIIQYVTETPPPDKPNPIRRPWDVNERQIDHYIARANRQFEKLAAVDRQAEFGKAKARMEYLYKNTVNAQDWKTALSVQKEVNALLGLNAPAKVRIIDESSVLADLRQRVEAGQLTREELLYVTDNNIRLADELFAGAALRVSTGENRAE